MEMKEGSGVEPPSVVFQLVDEVILTTTPDSVMTFLRLLGGDDGSVVVDCDAF
jgi:hypothetical protein